MFGLTCSSLPVNHHIEALQVSKVLASGLSGELPGKWTGSEFGIEVELLSFLKDETIASTAGDVNLELGQVESPDWEDRSWEVYSVNKDAVLVGNVNNDNAFSEVFSIVDVSDSAWLDKCSVTL